LSPAGDFAEDAPLASYTPRSQGNVELAVRIQYAKDFPNGRLSELGDELE
jgi:hypothetical protein